MKRYDAIIIGAGHNGLTAAAYLAKAGLDVNQMYDFQISLKLHNLFTVLQDGQRPTPRPPDRRARLCPRRVEVETGGVSVKTGRV